MGASFDLVLYSFIGPDGQEMAFTTRDARCAEQFARTQGLTLVTNRYTFVDSDIPETIALEESRS